MGPARTVLAGYRLINGTLVAIDYCAEQGHTCYEPTTCINVDGGFECSCPEGFDGDDGIICQDVDECAASPCDPRATCTNTPGSYTCACTTAGYIGNGIVCSDQDECAHGTDNCQADVGVCTNLLGSYSCACAVGLMVRASAPDSLGDNLHRRERSPIFCAGGT